MPKNVWVYESCDREFPNLSFPNVIFIKKKEIPLLSACIYNSLNYLLKKFSFVFHFLMWSHFEYLFLSLSALFSHTHAAMGRISTGPANTPGYYTLCTFEEWRLWIQCRKWLVFSRMLWPMCLQWCTWVAWSPAFLKWPCRKWVEDNCDSIPLQRGYCQSQASNSTTEETWPNFPPVLQETGLEDGGGCKVAKKRHHTHKDQDYLMHGIKKKSTTSSVGKYYIFQCYAPSIAG